MASQKPTDSRRLYLQIADRLRTVMYQPGFTSQGRLPPERALAEQLGVSRPSIREALVALELEGRVEIRMGSGVYLTQAAPPGQQEEPAPDKEMGNSLSDIMGARAIFEGAIVALVAPLAKPRDIKALRAIYDTMERECQAGQSPAATDRDFHIRIARMTGNDVLVQTVARLYDERQDPISAKLLDHYEPEDSWLTALHEHREILEAIEARDAIQAQAAMQRHLKMSLKRTMSTMTRRDA
ncbi:FadR family transcriptional regulator [Herbaspirillum seropedicae]|nr:FadR/GntR family transcriptional regulator [Herbaspirillum seropedicae]AKN63968.1 GntR family transcriptional regulator [Herbaspirillum seropedicae]AON52538.1 GntR family transcriptional regulator [Herbaspirillum seropedicae]NQE29344.1 GntR family transcriptional regulator [Herbaspirillum seropedicae]QDD62887.1 FadR family transcriptional regulator [Herbaspirillum seropedicae]UMU19883.1 FadR family transcriptional regulator [Herbaspirillum seropedicae]